MTNYKKGMGVDLISEKDSNYRIFKVRQYRLRFRLFNGQWSQELVREVCIKSSAVGVVLYDPFLDSIVLVEQFRIGALSDEETPWLLELPAGVIEPGETLVSVAEREVKEETGCDIKNVEKMMEYWVTPGWSSEKMTLFVAQVDASQATGIHGLIEEGEDIRVKVYPLKDAFKMLEEGRIQNAFSVIGLQWLMISREKLRDKWFNKNEVI